jgi:hypothetical protein
MATTEKTDMDIAYELARKALANPKRRSGERRLAQALIDLSDRGHEAIRTSDWSIIKANLEKRLP